MYKINIFIFALLILIFIGFINNQIYSTNDAFNMMEQPHFLRRLGLAPRYCPYRYNY